jgi:hypothetical protein
MDHLRYPVGKFIFDQETALGQKAQWKQTIAEFPTRVHTYYVQLGDSKLETPYRPGGWTARQVIHHVADSHMHAYLRFKLALTEQKPFIKPYDEAPTAELADYSLDVNLSIALLDGLHARWTAIIDHMSDDDFDKVYVHPEYQKEFSLLEALGLYDWHCRHHLGHLGICMTS